MSTADQPRTPWWKNGLVVALAAAIIPAATFIQGTMQASKELELQQKKQKQELRLAYANLMVEGGIDRMALLADFLAETEDDAQMKSWAQNQQVVIRKQKAELEQSIATHQAQVQEARAKQAEAERQLAETKAEAARLAQTQNRQQQDYTKLVERIKNGEVSQLLAAAEQQKHLQEQEQLKLKKEAATKLAAEQEAALLAAKSAATKAGALSSKSQELLSGRLTPPSELFREQRPMPLPQRP
jgi:hypothetical protein